MATSANGFNDAMPTLTNFSFLLNCNSYKEWKKIGKCLNLKDQTINNISRKLAGANDKDKKAFLVIMASWRELAPLRKEDKRATFGNLRSALTQFNDFIEVINDMEKRWTEEDLSSFDICECQKPKALRIKKDKTLFVICPKEREKQCKRTYIEANQFLDPQSLHKDCVSPIQELRDILLMKSNLELVNFEYLSPHLIKEGVLSIEEYREITGRPQVSSYNYFKLFVEEILDKSDKGHVVKGFLEALRSEEKHTGHADLLKQLEKNKSIMMKVKDKENKKTDAVSKKRKRITKDEEGEKKVGPSKKKKQLVY